MCNVCVSNLLRGIAAWRERENITFKGHVHRVFNLPNKIASESSIAEYCLAQNQNQNNKNKHSEGRVR